jgi:hypothetical protein
MTADTHSEELKRAVERMHGGTASFIASVPVKETFEGKTVWEGVVHIFELAGNSLATRAYAWSTAEEGGKSRSIAVLHVPPVDSPQKAVRAAIVHDYRSGKAV